MNTKNFFLFNTFNTITAECDAALLEKAFRLCERYEKMLSRTIPGSDVWNINHSGQRYTAVSDETLLIIKTAEKIRQDSYGAFNIAVGELVSLWKVTSDHPEIPDPEEIEKRVMRINSSYLAFDKDKVCISDGISIDLGGIAKGYITDKTAQLLWENGVKSALLNFGGNIVTVGSKPDGTPWKIGLQDPSGKYGKEYFAYLELSDRTVVTSGTYERGFDKNGTRYHHILDPKTGWPVQNSITCVSVVGSDSMICDALSTALFVLGKNTGAKLAKEYGTEFVFLDRERKVSYSQEINLYF